MADEGPKQKSEEGLNEAATPASPPDSGRAWRAPPTIRLKATEIFNETRKAGDTALESARLQTGAADAVSAETGSTEPSFSAEPKFSVEPKSSAHSKSAHSTSAQSTFGESNPEKPAPEQIPPEKPSVGGYLPEKPKAAISPWVIAPISGAVAAALVIGVGWMLGWPPRSARGSAASERVHRRCACRACRRPGSQAGQANGRSRRGRTHRRAGKIAAPRCARRRRSLPLKWTASNRRRVKRGRPRSTSRRSPNASTRWRAPATAKPRVRKRRVRKRRVRKPRLRKPTMCRCVAS